MSTSLLSLKSNEFCQIWNSTQSFGKQNSIDLSVINIADIAHTIGERYTHGNIATIYRVKNSAPPRIYKIIPEDRFENGDEIRITKIASEIGVGPQFHQAFVVEQKSERFIVIEMDDADLSLGKWMERIAEEEDKATEKKETDSLTREESEFQRKLKKIQEEYRKTSEFVVVSVETKRRVNIDVAAVKLFGSEEVFYNQLFKKIKKLAERHISWGDSHCGNIMPNHGTGKEMQLIDFDSAKLWKNEKEAVAASMCSVYNQLHFNNFSNLSNLSQDSKTLINWFLMMKKMLE